MSELIFYHNPKCSKSREVASMLETSGKPFQTREYLKDPLSVDELKNLYTQLDKEDQAQFVRIKEQLFKDEPFDTSDQHTVFQRLESLPKLMERPIVSNGSRAIIGRPTTKIQELITS